MMMKYKTRHKKAFFIETFMIFTFLGSSAQASLCEKKPKTIFFDMGGVLFRTRRLGLANTIGKTAFLRYALTSNQPSRLKNRLFDVLYTMGKQSADHDRPVVTHRGMELPGIVVEWLRGTKTSQQIRDEIAQQIQKLDKQNFFESYAEKKVILRLANFMFTPAELIRNTKRIRRGTQLARKCKKAGNQVIIVSNWDKESFELLKQKYKTFFTRWVDTVVISAADHIQETKPHKTIYQKVIDHLHLNPKDCYLIDDQKENIDSAYQHHNITGLHCPKRKSLKEAKKFLQHEKVL